MTKWVARSVKVDDYDGWAFLKADRNIGSWRPTRGSPNTLEKYKIGIVGTWVPTVDVPWLLGFKKRCACNAKRWVWMFAQVRPTARQMAEKPSEPPRMRVIEQSKFGLTKGD